MVESDLEREKSISLDADLNEKRISKEKDDLLNTENKLLDVEGITERMTRFPVSVIVSRMVTLARE